MLHTTESKKLEAEMNFSVDAETVIENHIRTATHLEEAAEYHRIAAKYHEEGNHEKAHKSSIFALGHCCLARELLREDAKRNANKNFK